MEIKRLEDLRKMADEETIRRIFMEYISEINAKAQTAEYKDKEEAYREGYQKGHDDCELGI